MSDTENKTENSKETTAADTAPYMKKTSHNDKTASNKTEMLVPAVLLLVSAIVIGATFYGNKNADTQTQKEDTPAITAATEVENIVKTPASDTRATQEQSVSNTETTKQIATEKNATKTETSQQSSGADTKQAAAVAEIIVITEEEVAVAEPQIAPASHIAAAHTTHASGHAPYQYNPYRRQQTQAITRTRVKQHMAMLQQRRQAYEREMQARHAQYEAAMKAQYEKRTRIAEAKKAVFQRAQKNRLVIKQKIQGIEKQIGKLHEEIYQLMNEYRRTSAPVQMHSM